MKEEITQALLLVQIIAVSVIALFFLEVSDKQKRKMDAVQEELYYTRVEMAKLKEEIKHNDNIVLKLLEHEW